MVLMILFDFEFDIRAFGICVVIGGLDESELKL